jgi:uncharacterized protein YceK
MKHLRRVAIVAVASLMLLGCQSVRSWDECPGIYSGVRYFGDQVNELPWDGRLFFALDLPFTSVFDTLALPFTSFAEPTRPPGGWVRGCRWAGP